MFAAIQKCPSGLPGSIAAAERPVATPDSRKPLRSAAGAWPPSQYLGARQLPRGFEIARVRL